MITLIHPYYDNPKMLQHQLECWNKFSKDTKEGLSVIVVDDCSKKFPALNAVRDFSYINHRKDLGFDFSLYRVKQKVRWNWLTCRNIAAKHAKKNEWLLLTDMDHRVPESTIIFLKSRIKAGVLSKNNYYIFDRVDAPKLTPYKRHPNTYFMHKSTYWKIGGYDEWFSGNYGSDGRYRRRANRVTNGGVVFENIFVIRYPREVIADASTTEFRRKEGRDPNALKKIEMEKSRLGKADEIKTCSFPYERQI